MLSSELFVIDVPNIPLLPSTPMTLSLNFEEAVHSSLKQNTSRDGGETWESLADPILEICQQQDVTDVTRIENAIREAITDITMRDMPGGHLEDALDRAGTVGTYVKGILSRLPIQRHLQSQN